MNRHDEIKARCEAGRPIPRIDVKWLLSEAEQLTARAERAEAERDAAVEDLKYYLENNEESGVVYVPKFVVEKIIKQRGAQEEE